MNKKTLITVALTAIVTLVIAPRLRSLPVIGNLPTV